MSSRFVRDSGTLLSGNMVAQGVSFLSYLVLTRLFSPDDFGLYNVFYSYIEVLIILSTCKYELAIVCAETDAEAGALARSTLRMNAVVSAVVLLAGGVVACGGVVKAPLPPELLLLVAVMVFFCGTTRVYTSWLNRYGLFGPMAMGEVVTSLTGVVMKVAMGLLARVAGALHVLGLPLGTVLGKVGGNVYLRYRLWREQPRQGRDVSMRRMMTKYKNYPMYVMPKELVSSFSANLPFMWLALYFDNALIGLFALSLTFTMRPLGILAGGFEKVLFPSSVAKVRQGAPLGGGICRFVLLLNAVVLPLAGVAFFFSEPIFTFLFGAKWVGTGYYVRCILPWFVVLLTANSLAFVANVFGTQRVDFGLQVVQLVLRVVALWVGCHVGDFRLAVLLFCLAGAAVQAVQAGWYLWQIYRYDKKLIYSNKCQE